MSTLEVRPMEVAALGAAAPNEAAAVVSTDWRRTLPMLAGRRVVLRELRLADAPSLHAMLAAEEVARFISPPPSTVEGFERFIEWTLHRRAAGDCVCFGVVPEGWAHAVGIIQVRRLEPDFRTAEWGFALGQPFWGTGVFVDAAALVLEFAFETLGVERLEARAAVANGRGNGALAKVGATRECVLRRSFRRHGGYMDQVLWSILRSDWRRAKVVWSPRVH
ncbi:MAG TPA: GNAT family N-acetyltransferase [Vicinamibacterales bacterium]|nr:GNAT family N-acetyltransferase [Vicinamibacterales bacterium]